MIRLEEMRIAFELGLITFYENSGESVTDFVVNSYDEYEKPSIQTAWMMYQVAYRNAYRKGWNDAQGLEL